MKTWQDKVIGVSLVMFAVFLIPTILGADKPPLLTSIPTALGQIVIAYCTYTLRLYFTATICATLGLLWGIIVWQVW